MCILLAPHTQSPIHNIYWRDLGSVIVEYACHSRCTLARPWYVCMTGFMRYVYVCVLLRFNNISLLVVASERNNAADAARRRGQRGETSAGGAQLRQKPSHKRCAHGVLIHLKDRIMAFLRTFRREPAELVSCLQGWGRGLAPNFEFVLGTFLCLNQTEEGSTDRHETNL